MKNRRDLQKNRLVFLDIRHHRREPHPQQNGVCASWQELVSPSKDTDFLRSGQR